MPLLCDLGMAVHGVEIAKEICRRTVERLAALGYVVEARVGRNHQIPYANAYFDHILACHACYYVDPGTTCLDNVKEIARVLKPNGRFVFSAPMGTSYILMALRRWETGICELPTIHTACATAMSCASSTPRPRSRRRLRLISLTRASAWHATTGGVSTSRCGSWSASRRLEEDPGYCDPRERSMAPGSLSSPRPG